MRRRDVEAVGAAVNFASAGAIIWVALDALHWLPAEVDPRFEIGAAAVLVLALALLRQQDVASTRWLRDVGYFLVNRIAIPATDTGQHAKLLVVTDTAPLSGGQRTFSEFLAARLAEPGGQ